MRNVLIAGTGYLGESMAYDFLRHGFHVTVNSRNEKKLDDIKNRLSAYGSIDHIAMELKDMESCKNLMDEMHKRHGSIFGLIVSVGGYVEDSIEDPSGLDVMINNHLKIPVYLASAALKYMDHGSSIMFISNSTADRKSNLRTFSYTISKYALNKAVKIAAVNLINKGIRVNAVAPEYIIESFEPNRDYHAMHKYGKPETPVEDISRVVYDIMAENDWINGEIIAVDGGHSLL
ncbi:SDR family oxidoreductase [Picrophilus oshimae]|uniref:3-oxoacyl-[acyl-carrier protein] reductase n=1 Tax=Picrophilus torridus (strain ATCC 700027 / DSM 9790 / JCM 10055 / NBRC 100828 / KAW 2/3) TaxID=1122961 RepID=Q6L0C7_PICTO|nr:SDR family oxidoreductase [Picrophilus oshimae]AAT43575.1 3-oxoacyl-[acyl-carrier protein] reductase [Picrophilus oshimae DSM 9789]